VRRIPNVEIIQLDIIDRGGLEVPSV
jgi:hypothetical protein